MKKAMFMLMIAVVVAGLIGAWPASGADTASPAILKTNPFAGKIDMIKAGEKIFDERCADCHGGDAMGGSGPDLTDEKWLHGGDDDAVFESISRGRKGGMPSWGGQLNNDEIWKVVSYIRSLSKKK